MTAVEKVTTSTVASRELWITIQQVTYLPTAAANLSPLLYA